jgi:hypothetical protein
MASLYGAIVIAIFVVIATAQDGNVEMTAFDKIMTINSLIDNPDTFGAGTSGGRKMPIWEEAAKGKRCEGSTPQVDVESKTVDSGRTMCADACARRATYFSFGKCTNRDGKRFCKCNCETKVRDHECIKQVDDKGFDLYEILEVPADKDMFEGDVVDTKELQQQIGMMEAQESAGISGFDAISRGAWPSGRVFYTFARSFSSTGRSVVAQAIAEIQSKTCIKIQPRTNQRNYIQFFHGSGCYSMIGQQGGRQQVSLASPGCLQKGVAVHEIMHALGFFHEQSRLDRDTYIRINWANINSAMYYNFKKYRQGQASTLGEPYDKKSVMHYGNYAFSINRRQTITSLSNPNERLGQRVGLSAIDVRQLNKYYKCEGTTTVVTAKPPPAGGKDMYPFCVALPKYCTNAWVKTNCKATCKTEEASTPCQNKNNYCTAWSNTYCRSGTYLSYMKGNCQKACKQKCARDNSSAGGCGYFKALSCKA